MVSAMQNMINLYPHEDKWPRYLPYQIVIEMAIGNVGWKEHMKKESNHVQEKASSSVEVRLKSSQIWQITDKVGWPKKPLAKSLEVCHHSFCPKCS